MHGQKNIKLTIRAKSTVPLIVTIYKTLIFAVNCKMNTKI